ncbi:MAG: AarF/ABC1/UbiB kinase family protein [Desulfobacteraceae bacterium]|nr:MAG: AarF/ABC1/UbiB kinase family protein [Desulfobacteraceae bacterium]
MMAWPDLKRYSDLIGLFLQFGWLETRKSKSAEPVFSDDALVTPINAAQADKITQRLEQLGPCYIKLGQFLSSRSDILPRVMVTSLSRLQDRVQPFAFDHVRRIVEGELGVRLSRGFAEFESEPFASASLSQVHRAALPGGRRVAVKVQRPDIQSGIYKDIETLQKVAAIVDRTTRVGRRLRTRQIIEEFRKVVTRELDFRIEAAQITALRENLRRFDHIVLPEPVDAYSTGKVLTMSLIAGRKITEITPLSRTEFNGAQLADEVFGAYLHQVLIDGLFHADPHPGNILITDDHKIAMVDLGMVSALTPDVQNKLIKFLNALNEGNGHQAGTQLLDLSTRAYDFNEKAYFNQMTVLIGKYQGFGSKPLEIGRMVMDILQISAQCGIILPTELTLLGKTMLNLDQVGRTLNPDFDPAVAIRNHIRKILRRKMRRESSLNGLLNTMFEARELVTMTPQRLNAFLEKLADNNLSLRLDVLDEKYLMTGFQKIANRLTTGLILAALIIGAAFMMNVRTAFTLMGYPGLAVIFFFLAGLGGLVLILTILFQDEASRRK